MRVPGEHARDDGVRLPQVFPLRSVLGHAARPGDKPIHGTGSGQDLRGIYGSGFRQQELALLDRGRIGRAIPKLDT
eukprot:4518705-Alexandrium_andersonii.AAC.1